jgi:hypothetical protein
MHKLLKKTMKHELSYYMTRLKVHNRHQLLKKMVKLEAQLSKGYNIL